MVFYPSWPKSSVNFDNFFRSSSLTVGLVLAKDFNMSLWNKTKQDNFYVKTPADCSSFQICFTIVTGGSNNLSPGTSIQVISNAPASPGEHGVTRSSRITDLSRGEGPRTFFKNFFFCYFLKPKQLLHNQLAIITLKWVAVCTFRTGCINASLTIIEISAPE